MIAAAILYCLALGLMVRIWHRQAVWYSDWRMFRIYAKDYRAAWERGEDWGVVYESENRYWATRQT